VHSYWQLKYVCTKLIQKIGGGGGGGGGGGVVVGVVNI